MILDVNKKKERRGLDENEEEIDYTFELLFGSSLVYEYGFCGCIFKRGV
ncbi:MAG TPA: hypothetical protein PK033_11540 [Acetivibrio sp.]|nr:hypothetical protein [Acetivibrio sp.]